MPTTTTTSPAPSPILGITGNETPRETLEVIRNFVGIVRSGRAEPGQPDEDLFLFHYRITELGAPDGAFVPFDDDIVVDAGFGVCTAVENQYLGQSVEPTDILVLSQAVEAVYEVQGEQAMMVIMIAWGALCDQPVTDRMVASFEAAAELSEAGG